MFLVLSPLISSIMTTSKSLDVWSKIDLMHSLMYFSTFLTHINTLTLGFILSSFQKSNPGFSYLQTRMSDSKSGSRGFKFGRGTVRAPTFQVASQTSSVAFFAYLSPRIFSFPRSFLM
jgi:hypothetical protein